MSLFAYTTHRTTAGTLSMHFGTPDRLAKQEKITETDEPLELTATLENKGDTLLSVNLTFQTIETLEFVDSGKRVSQTVELPAGEKTDVTVKVVARAGTLTAHYPVRLDVEYKLNGDAIKAHIIQVIETNFPGSGTSKNPLFGQVITDPKQLPLNTLPTHGGLALAALDTYRGVWNHDDKPLQILPVGFQGIQPTSSAYIARLSMDRGGVARQSLGMHPPYQYGIGNVGVEYRIKLPDTQPIALSFFSAMRDTSPPEPPTDGVTYRVKVEGKTVYEKHDANNDWVAHEINLTEFAGKEILLTLESDPGPARNTVCDSCFWGDVILFAGEKPAILSAEARGKLFTENLQAVKTGKTDSPKTHVYKLDGGLIGAVTFGENGFIDGVIGLGNAEKQVQFDGLRVWVKGQPIGASPSALSCGQWTPREPATVSPHQWRQEIEVADRKGTLFFGIKQNGPALQLSLNSSEIDLIDRIEFGPATHHAPKVYYGHGFCIVEPEAFTALADGHNLSTSHVGMDFENGLSVLQATSFPPDSFIVDPKTKRYTLSVHPATTFTLLPGLSGALDCAIQFRPLHEAKPAPGFTTKAGRMVFDIWGGRYSQHTEIVQHAAKYGLTDTIFIVHNWQHYGYDNRLPDIYPPNPTMGTLQDMQETLKLCDSLGILYGIHDNYIDFYPDADEFSFDITSFDVTGQPRLGWDNFFIEARAYQFRPDRVQRYLDRNLDIIVPNLPVSAYFVDVFSSMPPVDYYDREGNFHSRAETRHHWAKVFDTIRARLSEANKNFPSAITTGESGMDSLIGHLDGADSNFMFISSEPGEFRINIKCKEWSRVPWYDAVHHTKFSLHGAGYSNRYEVMRGRDNHGIESDDYITSEILTGHAMMVDWDSAKRGAVRKYWLAQDFMRHLADKDIINVEFVDGNIQHQKITWSGDATVWVNLDKSDWTIKPDAWGPDFVLPLYGYCALSPIGFSAIHKRDGRVVESARTEFPERGIITGYANARQKGWVDGLLPIMPSVNSFQYLGENRFTATFKWNAKEPAPKDLGVFVHCAEKRQRVWIYRPVEAVLGGAFPTVPTSQWSGEIITDNHAEKNAAGQPVMTIPDSIPAGRHYFIVGLYDANDRGQRAKLIGYDADSNRYVVGWLNVERKDGAVSNITLEPFEWDDAELYERLLPPMDPVEFFTFCKTKGAFKVEYDTTKKVMLVTPLPDEPATEVAMSINLPKSVKAIDEAGKELRDVPFTFNAGEKYPLVFTTQAGEFAYRIVW